MNKIMKRILNIIFVFLLLGYSLNVYFKWMEHQSIIKDIILMILTILSVIAINLIMVDRKVK